MIPNFAQFSTLLAIYLSALMLFDLSLPSLMTPIANFSPVPPGLSSILVFAPRMVDDRSHGRVLLCTKGSALALSSSWFSWAHWVAMHFDPSPWDYGWVPFSIPSSLVTITCCSSMMDSNVHISVCKMMTCFSEESLSSPYNSGWTWYRVSLGSMDIMTLPSTGLGTSYNTWHCGGHLLTPYWLLLGWIWLLRRDLRHLQQPVLLLIGCMIVKTTCDHNPILLIVFQRWLNWQIFNLCRFFIYVAGCSLARAAVRSFVNDVACYTRFCSGTFL